MADEKCPYKEVYCPLIDKKVSVEKNGTFTTCSYFDIARKTCLHEKTTTGSVNCVLRGEVECEED